MKKVSFILLSGGKGIRMNNDVPKQYMLLGGKPIIIHSLERVESIAEIDQVIIVCEEKYVDTIKEFAENYSLKKAIDFAPAGKDRQSSVKNGLKLAKNEVVIIHEAARPFVQTKTFETLIRDEAENITLGYGINYTVLIQKEGYISGNLERSSLLNIQLPQKFNRDLLLECHALSEQDDRVFTEDAGMIYHYKGAKIKVIKGSSTNLKITEPLDIILGEQIYRQMFLGR